MENKNEIIPATIENYIENPGENTYVNVEATISYGEFTIPLKFELHWNETYNLAINDVYFQDPQSGWWNESIPSIHFQDPEAQQNWYVLQSIQYDDGFWDDIQDWRVNCYDSKGKDSEIKYEATYDEKEYIINVSIGRISLETYDE